MSNTTLTPFDLPSSDIPVGDYLTYRGLALDVIGQPAPAGSLPTFFAPRPMSGTLTFGSN